MAIIKLLGVISRGIEYLCSLFFLLMCVGLTVQVVVRYTVGNAVFWAEELARYAMVWIVYLGAIVAVRQKAHTRIDFFVNLLPRKMERYAAVLVDLICIAFLAIIIHASLPILTIGMTMKSIAMQLPMIYVYGALPLCSVLMIMYFIVDIFQALRPGHERDDSGREKGGAEC